MDKMNKVFRTVCRFLVITCAAGVAFVGFCTEQQEPLVEPIYAKYVKEVENEDVAVPDSFHFTSNYLTEDQKAPLYRVYDEQVEIKLQNHDGLNISSDAISYTFSYNGGNLTQEPASTTLSGGQKSEASYILTAPAGTTVTVTAKAQAPYEKILGASFVFHDRDENCYYSVKDTGYVVYVDVWTGKDPVSTLTFRYDSLVPDSEAGLTLGWKDETSGTIELVPNAHYTLIFFDGQNTARDYTVAKTRLSVDTLTLAAK